MEKELSTADIARYARHVVLPEVGLNGQKKLKNASVLVVGTGGLGSAVSLYLAAAGIGHIGLVDYDVVDLTNLQRQVIHSTGTIGMSKVESAVQRLSDINPEIKITGYAARFSADNAKDIAQAYDIIVDGTDNFYTRYLINDLCVLTGKTYVYGSIYQYEGQVAIFDAQQGPCYRCIFPSPPPEGSVHGCAVSGVLGILPGTIGTMQATETIKHILAIGKPLVGKLLFYDALSMEMQTIQLKKNPTCAVCGTHPAITSLEDTPDAYNSAPRPVPIPESCQLLPSILASWLAEGTPIQLLDVREDAERLISKIAGSRDIPQSDLKQRLSELDPSIPVVVICRSGIRSARAVITLHEAGYQAFNLQGGINAWAAEIDPNMIRY